MSNPDVVLHIGMQQSGATMLQRALSGLRPQLRAHGVAYVDHGQLNGLDSAAGWGRDAGADRRKEAGFERELAETVERERQETAAAGGGAHTVLLSSDHLVGSRNIDGGDADPFRPQAGPAVSQVIRALGAERVRLLLYTHRQDRLLEFCYLREVQKGRHHRFGDQFPRRFEPICDYVGLIERLSALPEVCDVTIRPFELIGAGAVAFVDDFLDVVGLQGALDLGPIGGRLSPRRVYSRQGLQIALAMNPHLETDEDRRLVRDFLINNFAATDDGRSRFISKRVRQQILDAYAEPNRQLFRTCLPDLPEDSYASDTSTARLGAVLRPSAAGGDTDAPDTDAPDTPGEASPPRVRGLVGTLALPVRGGGKKHPPRRAAAAVRLATDPIKDRAGRAADRVPLFYGLKLRYLARRCDAFLVSFPKCGRTWLRVMVGIALGERFGVQVRNLRRFTNADIRHPGVPRVLATHDDSPQGKRAHQVIGNKRGYRGAKVILLVRDPGDVVVSLYFHVTRRRRQAYDGSLSDFVRDPVGSLASLLAFYDAWAAHLAAANVLLVRYEDMHADPRRELRRVLDFLGVGQVRDATVERAVEEASFDRLQRMEREGTAGTRALRTKTAADPESYKVRRGKVGGYVDYLDDADVSYVAAAVASSHGARDLGYASSDADASMEDV